MYVIYVIVSIKADVRIHCFQLGREDYACYAGRTLSTIYKLFHYYYYYYSCYYELPHAAISLVWFTRCTFIYVYKYDVIHYICNMYVRINQRHHSGHYNNS